MKKITVNSIRYEFIVMIFTGVTFFLMVDSGFAGAQFPNPDSKSNIIFLAIDDLNDWINPPGPGGLPGLKTPNFDRLRKMSMSFTNAHISSPASAPSRVSIMTGVSPARSGVTGWKHPACRKVPELSNLRTMMDIFPTLAELAGEKISEYCDGESLVPMLKPERFDHKPAFAAYFMNEEGGSNSGDGYTIRSNSYRYIYYPFINLEELYDHQLNPDEWNNTAYKVSSKSIIKEQRKLLMDQVPGLSWTDAAPKGYTIGNDESVKKQGYVKIADLKEMKWGL